MRRKYLVIPCGPVSEPGRWPSVSFCIATKNRERTIESCLRSIRAFEYPAAIQIVVVDNGSTDRTLEIAQRYADVVLEDAGTLGAVRQLSVEASNGEILGIIDDDLVFMHPHWLMNAVRLFEIDEHVSTVWPQLVPPAGAPWSTRCFFNINNAIFADRAKAQRWLFGGGNSLFRRDAVLSVGGFDRSSGFGEDVVLASRLKRDGYSVVYCADPVVHDTMYSLREIMRKQRWGALTLDESNGFDALYLNTRDVMREQYVVAARAMLRGLLMDRDLSWLMYPLLAGTKTLAYGEVGMRSLAQAMNNRSKQKS